MLFGGSTEAPMYELKAWGALQWHNYHWTRVDKVQGPSSSRHIYYISTVLLTKSKIYVTTGHELSGSSVTRQLVCSGQCSMQRSSHLAGD